MNVYSSHAAFVEKSRSSKAKKIISILGRYKDLSTCAVLDIGTGSGHIIQEIAKHCKTAVSVNISDERIVTEGYEFYLVKDEILPFAEQSFDVVITNHVIEHTPQQSLHLSEIHRVLKKCGIVYLATPNKYTFIEPHFNLPFLSWLPIQWATLYLNFLRHKTWDVYPLSKKKLYYLVDTHFKSEDITLSVVKNPDAYGISIPPLCANLIQRTPLPILKILCTFVPTFILILKTKENNKTV